MNILYRLLPDIKKLIDKNLMKTVKMKKDRLLVAKDILKQINKIPELKETFLVREFSYLRSIKSDSPRNIAGVYASAGVVCLGNFINNHSDNISDIKTVLEYMPLREDTKDILIYYNTYKEFR